MARQIQIDLLFNANAQAAKAQIEQLAASLNTVANTQINVNGGSIHQASQAAQQLQMHLANAVNVDTGRLNLNQFNMSLKQSGANLNQLMSTMRAAGPSGETAFMQVSKAIGMADISAMKLNGALAGFGKTLMSTIKWSVASSMIQGFVGGCQKAVGHLEDLNKALNDIRIVTGYSTDYMANFADKAREAAKALNTTTDEFAKASLIFYQQGLAGEEVLERAETVVKLAQVTGETAETVSDYMTAIWNNFYDGSKSLEYYADVLTKLGAATATSTDEIAGGLEKFASVGKTIGLSYEYASAALTTITANTRQSEEVVGTALKTILSRIQGLKLGETLEDGVDLNKYSQALKTVGVDVLDSNEKLKDMDTILDELGEKWNGLGRAQQAALAQTVGGIRQYNQFIALMDNWEPKNSSDSDSFLSNLDHIAEATGELAKQQKIWSESWEAASQRMAQSANQLYESLLKDTFFTKTLDVFSSLIDGVGTFIENIGGIGPILLLSFGVFAKTLLPLMISGFSSLTNNIGAFFGLNDKKLVQIQYEQAEYMRLQGALAGVNTAEGQMYSSRARLIEQNAYFNSVIKNLTQEQKLAAQASLDSANATLAEAEALAEKKKAQDLVAAARGKQASSKIKESALNQVDNSFRTRLEAENQAAGESIYDIDEVVETAKTRSAAEIESDIEDIQKQKKNIMSQDDYNRRRQEILNQQQKAWAEEAHSRTLAKQHEKDALRWGVAAETGENLAGSDGKVHTKEEAQGFFVDNSAAADKHLDAANKKREEGLALQKELEQLDSDFSNEQKKEEYLNGEIQLREKALELQRERQGVERNLSEASVGTAATKNNITQDATGQAMERNFMDKNFSGYGGGVNETTGAIQIETSVASYEAVIAKQTELNSSSEKMKAIQAEASQEASALEKAQKKVASAEENYNKILKSGNKNRTDVKKALKELKKAKTELATQTEKSKKSFKTLSSELTKTATKMGLDEKQAEALGKKLEEVAADGNLADKAFALFDSEMDAACVSASILDGKLTELTGEMQQNLMSAGLTEQEVSELTAAFATGAQISEELRAKLELVAEKLNGAGNAMSKITGISQALTGSITGMAQSLSMGVAGAQMFASAFKDGVDPLTKISMLLSGMTMIIPMVISMIKNTGQAQINANLAESLGVSIKGMSIKAAKEAIKVKLAEKVAEDSSTASRWAAVGANIAYLLSSPYTMALAAVAIAAIIGVTAMINKQTESTKAATKAQMDATNANAEAIDSWKEECKNLDQLIWQYNKLKETQEDTQTVTKDIREEVDKLANSYKNLSDNLSLIDTNKLKAQEHIALMQQAAAAGDVEGVNYHKKEINKLLAKNSIEDTVAARNKAKNDLVLASHDTWMGNGGKGKDITLHVGGNGTDENAAIGIIKEYNNTLANKIFDSDSFKEDSGWFSMAGADLALRTDTVENFLTDYENLIKIRNALGADDSASKSDIYRELNEPLQELESYYETLKEQEANYLSAIELGVDSGINTAAIALRKNFEIVTRNFLNEDFSPIFEDSISLSTTDISPENMSVEEKKNFIKILEDFQAEENTKIIQAMNWDDLSEIGTANLQVRTNSLDDFKEDYDDLVKLSQKFAEAGFNAGSDFQLLTYNLNTLQESYKDVEKAHNDYINSLNNEKILKLDSAEIQSYSNYLTYKEKYIEAYTSNFSEEEKAVRTQEAIDRLESNEMFSDYVTTDRKIKYLASKRGPTSDIDPSVIKEMKRNGATADEIAAYRKSATSMEKTEKEIQKFYDSLDDNKKVFFLEVDFNKYQSDEAIENELDRLQRQAQIDTIELKIGFTKDSLKLLKEDMTKEDMSSIYDKMKTADGKSLWGTDGLVSYDSFLSMSLEKQQETLRRYQQKREQELLEQTAKNVSRLEADLAAADPLSTEYAAIADELKKAREEVALLNWELNPNLDQKIATLNKALNTISSGEKLSQEQLLYLEKLEEEFPQLAEIADRSSTEYIQALNGIREKLSSEKILDLYEDLDAIEIPINIDSKQLDKKLDEIGKIKKQINVEIINTNTSATDDILNQFDKLESAGEAIGEGFVVAADDIRSVEAAFPGILEGYKVLEDGSIQLNRNIAQASMDRAKEEIESSKKVVKQEIEDDIVRLKKRIDVNEAIVTDLGNLLSAENLTQDEILKYTNKIGKEIAQADNLEKLEQVDNAVIAASDEITVSNEQKRAMVQNAYDVSKSWDETYRELSDNAVEAAKAQITANNKVLESQGLKASTDPSTLFNTYVGNQNKENPAETNDKTGEELIKLLYSSINPEGDKWRNKGYTDNEAIVLSMYEAGSAIEDIVAFMNSIDSNWVDDTDYGKAFWSIETDELGSLEAAVQQWASSIIPKEMAPENEAAPTIELSEDTKEKIAAIQAAYQDGIDTDKKTISNLQALIAELDGNFQGLSQVGKGSESEKEFNKEIERYHELEKTIESTERALKKLDKEKERVYGKDKLKLIDEEIKQYDILIAQQEKLINDVSNSGDINDYLWQAKENLKQYNAEYDENGNLINFDEMYAAEQAKLKKAYASQDKKAIEVAEKAYEDFEKAVQDYEKTSLKYLEEKEKLEELRYEKQLKQLEKITQKEEEINSIIEDRINLQQHYIKLAEYTDEKLSSTVKKQSSVLIETARNIIATRNAMNEIVAMAEKEGRKLNAEEISQLRTYASDLMSSIEDIYSQWEAIQAQYVNSLDKYTSEISEDITRISTMRDIVISFKNILDNSNIKLVLDGTKELKELNKQTENMLKNSFKLSNSKLQSLNAEYAGLEKVYNDLNKDLAQKGLTSSQKSELIEQIEATQDKRLEVQQEITDNWQTALEDADALFTLSVEQALSTFSSAMTEFSTLAQAREEFDWGTEESERYLSDADKIYELNKLNREISKEITKNTGMLAKSKLADVLVQVEKYQKSATELSQIELDNLRAKYELRLAEIALEEAQNNKTQMRLQRNANGSWNYVYTANQDAIDSATQNLEDKQKAVRDLNEENIQNQSDAILSNYESYEQAYQAIADKITNKEYKDKKELDKDISNLQKYVTKDAYLRKQMETSLKELGISYEDTLLGQIEGADSLMEKNKQLNESHTSLISALDDAWDTYEENLKQVAENAGTSYKDMGDDFESTSNKYAKTAKELEKEISDTIKEMVKELPKVSSEILKVAKDWDQKLQGMIDKTHLLLEEIMEVIEKTADLGKDIPEVGYSVKNQDLVNATSNLQKTGNVRYNVGGKDAQGNAYQHSTNYAQIIAEMDKVINSKDKKVTTAMKTVAKEIQDWALAERKKIDPNAKTVDAVLKLIPESEKTNITLENGIEYIKAVEKSSGLTVNQLANMEANNKETKDNTKETADNTKEIADKTDEQLDLGDKNLKATEKVEGESKDIKDSNKDIKKNTKAIDEEMDKTNKELASLDDSGSQTVLLLKKIYKAVLEIAKTLEAPVTESVGLGVQGAGQAMQAAGYTSYSANTGKEWSDSTGSYIQGDMNYAQAIYDTTKLLESGNLTAEEKAAVLEVRNELVATRNSLGKNGPLNATAEEICNAVEETRKKNGQEAEDTQKCIERAAEFIASAVDIDVTVKSGSSSGSSSSSSSSTKTTSSTSTKTTTTQTYKSSTGSTYTSTDGGNTWKSSTGATATGGEDAKKWLEANGFDTGGYTGDWYGEDGRMALLHKKELVLNRQDTENMLEMIKIIRSIAPNILDGVRVNAGSMYTSLEKDLYGKVHNSNPHNAVEQNVRIEANFPNVESASDIKEALNNLVNEAAQHASVYRLR